MRDVYANRLVVIIVVVVTEIPDLNEDVWGDTSVGVVVVVVDDDVATVLLKIYNELLRN